MLPMSSRSGGPWTPDLRAVSALPAFFLVDRHGDAPFALLGPEEEHALRVLRLQPGDSLLGLDGRGRRWRLRVEQVATARLSERGLWPNVDLFSGCVFNGLGVPIDFYTPLFAASRTLGWMVHLQEQWDSGNRLFRPRQIYTGEQLRDFVSVHDIVLACLLAMTHEEVDGSVFNVGSGRSRNTGRVALGASARPVCEAS